MSKEERGLASAGAGQSQNIEIKLKMEEAVVIKNVEGKKKAVPEKSPDGQSTYIVNDIISLQNLLGKFDTTKHPQREWGPWAAVKEKLYRCYANQELKLVLTLQEASFLKVYLEELPTREAKTLPLRDTEVRTRQAVLDQLYAIDLKKKA
ncbi:hypothetical protein KA005_03625 [bacterium]|nr:hypothetical protein [bacterium]